MKLKDRSKTARLIKNIRSTLELTQEELAIRVGKNRCDIVKYETEKVTPPGDVLLRIIELVDHNAINMIL